jgi:hypothetical protein
MLKLQESQMYRVKYNMIRVMNFNKYVYKSRGFSTCYTNYYVYVTTSMWVLGNCVMLMKDQCAFDIGQVSSDAC